MMQIVDMFLSHDRDLGYQFAMICEHFRLAGGDESEQLNDINEFYYLMAEAIAMGHCDYLEVYDLRKPYDSQELLVCYEAR